MSRPSIFGLLVGFGAQCTLIGMQLAARIYHRSMYAPDASAYDRWMGIALPVLLLLTALLMGREIMRRVDRMPGEGAAGGG